MNVGGEDVYGALLKARDKNELLKYRLSEELRFIDRQKKQSKHMLTNDIFDERKEAYRLQREVTDIELRHEEKRRAIEAKKRKGWEALRRRKTFLVALAGLAEKKESKPGIKGTQMALLSPEKEYVQRNHTRSANEWKDKLLPELELNRSKSLVVLSSYWVGDPKAIDSVRRDRKTPEEMGTYTRFLQGFRHAARKSIRSSFCSRQRCRGAYVGDAGFTDVSHMNLRKFIKKAKHIRIKDDVESAEQNVEIPTPAEGQTAGGVIKALLSDAADERTLEPKSRENTAVSDDSGIEADTSSVVGLSRSHTLPQILEESESTAEVKREGKSPVPSRPFITSSTNAAAGLYSQLTKTKSQPAPRINGFHSNLKHNKQYDKITSPIAELRRMSTNFLNREDVVTVDVNKSVRIHKTVNFNADAVEHKKHLARRRIILPDMIF